VTAEYRDDDALIVIGAPTLVARALAGSCFRVRYFQSLADLDRWRCGSKNNDFGCSLGKAVDVALDGVSRSGCSLPAQLRLAFAWLREQTSVPPLKRFASTVSSRRSFPRAWSRSGLDAKPKEFLHTVAILHARLLLAAGVPIEKAFVQTGVRSLKDLGLAVSDGVARNHAMVPLP